MIHIRSLAVLAAVMIGAGAAAAQQRCEGTLCDLYYGGSAPEQPASAKAAAPTPLTVPTMPSVSGSYLGNLFSRSGDAGAAPAGAAPVAGQQAAAPQGAAPQREGFFHMGGGGITGQTSGECGGTICDLLHGHSSQEEGSASVSQSVNGVPASRYGSETASAEPVAASAASAASAGAAPPATYAPPPAERRVAARAAPKAPPACALKGGDPWACYRR